MSKAAQPPQPSQRHQTLRRAMLDHLREGPLTSRDLSGLLGIREKDVSAHLEHLVRSLKRSDERLHVEPAECLGCGYIFADRKRLTRPSACPKCRAQRIEAPIFSLRDGPDS